MFICILRHSLNTDLNSRLIGSKGMGAFWTLDTDGRVKVGILERTVVF